MEKIKGFFSSKKSTPDTNESEPELTQLNYGNTCFMSFYASTMTRLSYFDDNKFIQFYNQIMGNVIPESILTDINKVVSSPNSDLKNLFNDELSFDLRSGTFKTYNNKNGKFIDYVEMNMPQDINIITDEMTGVRTYPEANIAAVDQNIKYISLACSNYGNVYIVADKRMPNVIQVIFRGTYSAKTAGSYSKPTSLVPLKVEKGSNEAFMYGIFKITTDMFNTIIESIRYLAVNFLGNTEPNSVTILTFGHSLGGAMTTLFSYLWSKLKENVFYNSSPYHILKSNIFCISLGAPRCMNNYASDEFCKRVSEGLIVFKRIVTKGDLVPGMPSKKFGFSHPCSTKKNRANGMRDRVNEDCSDVLSKIPLYPKYNSSIKCEPENTKSFTMYNPLSHTLYFYIMYSKAANIPEFFKGMATQQEVLRSKKGETVVRVNIGNQVSLKTAFFILDHVRDVPSNDAMLEEKMKREKSSDTIDLTNEPQMGGGKVSEDIKMTAKVFDKIISNTVEIPAASDRNLLVPPNNYLNVLSIIKDIEADQYRTVNSNKGGMRRRKTIRKRTTKRKGTRKN